jgi:hypothetical protein
MRLYQHMAVSGVISAGVYAASRSVIVAGTSFLAGFLIDLDHIIDYWLTHPWRFNVRHFFVTCEEYRLKSIYLFLHSWELIIMLCLLSYVSRSAVALGLMLGFVHHLVLDQIFNYVYPAGYFFIYRWKVGFLCDAVFDIPEVFREARNDGNH